MDKKYVYVQPEYVRRFQCDGQKCGARCCQGWTVTIDPSTQKKYAGLKPKSEARRIVEHIKFKPTHNCYVVELRADGRCPFLTDDDWCSIQKKYGEKFLSITCTSYPRVTHAFDGFYERALSMTCPVATELILSSSEPMSFEQIEVDERYHRAGGNIHSVKLPRGVLEQAFNVQYAAISILQSRNLSIDGRLIVLGFYLDRLDELIGSARIDEIENLSAVYSSEEFLDGEARRLLDGIDFDDKKYIRTMFGLLDALYGEQSKFGGLNRRYIDAVSDVLDIALDEDKGASLSELAKNYRRLDGARQKFLERHSIELEHYLVNEFFLGLYPWKITGTIAQNYGLFVATYKILELIGLSLEVQWAKWHDGDSEPPTEYRLPATIATLSTNVDHTQGYLECVSTHLDGDVLSIMKSLL